MRTQIWLAAIAMLFGGFGARAQGIGGFFHQQADKKKLMIEQIASITLYNGQQGKGYAIDDNGLSTAHQHKNDEMASHTAYYQSLSSVNPAVGADDKKKTILGLQARINAAFSTELDWQRKNKELRSDELAYLQKVADGINAKCLADATELQAVTTPGKLQLTDAERLERLDKLLKSTNDKLAFALSFTQRCRKLAAARLRQKVEQQQLQKLYGN